jgi:hypothetical protein
VSAVVETLGIAALLPAIPRRCRAANASVWRSPARWRAIHACCYSTSRCRGRRRAARTHPPWLLRVRDEWQVPMLYVTHNVGEALAIADQALLLREGAVEGLGSATALLGSPSLASDAASGIENLLPGRVAGHDDAAASRASTSTAA